jgi:hypothetical protein
MGVRISRASAVLLVVQLALVSSVAAKYLYQRRTCPRAWTRAAADAPELVMGRYLSLQLTADGCGSTLPSAGQAEFPRNPDGTVASPQYKVRTHTPIQFQAILAVEKVRLVPIHLPQVTEPRQGQTVSVWPGSGCENLRVVQPANF